jgi:hypothetical protein
VLELTVKCIDQPVVGLTVYLHRWHIDVTHIGARIVFEPGAVKLEIEDAFAVHHAIAQIGKKVVDVVGNNQIGLIVLRTQARLIHPAEHASGNAKNYHQDHEAQFHSR